VSFGSLLSDFPVFYVKQKILHQITFELPQLLKEEIDECRQFFVLPFKA
jgi:hypothetical protein